MDAPECPGCRELRARNAELEARVLTLEAQVRDLLDKLKPPTPQGQTPQPAAPVKKPTGKKPGGQPGHPPLRKTLVPPERVNQVVPYVPDRCAKCDQALPAKAGVGIRPGEPAQGRSDSRRQCDRRSHDPPSASRGASIHIAGEQFAG